MFTFELYIVFENLFHSYYLLIKAEKASLYFKKALLPILKDLIFIQTRLDSINFCRKISFSLT